MTQSLNMAPRLRACGRILRSALLAASATLAIITGSMEPAQAMDTDVFSATTSSTTAPNVLIILDNTSNWSRQDQHFPGGITQGQAEVDAIKTAISSLPGHINIGMMEFPTGGRNDSGGYIRYAISPMGTSDTSGSTNRTAFSTILTTIYNNITDPKEKLNSGMQYGDLMRDAYNYLAGYSAYATSSDVDSTKADSNGYTTNYTQFKSPLTSSGSCAATFIIFIGNPNSRGPVADSADNLSALSTAGGDTTQLKLPNYTLTNQNVAVNIDYSNSCYSATPTSTTDSTYVTCQSSVSNGTYSSCSYDSSQTTSTMSTCSSGYRYQVSGTTTTSTSTQSTTTTAGTTSSCYTSSTGWSASTDTGGLSCGTSSGNTSYSCSYALTSTTGTSSGCTPLTSTNTTSSSGTPVTSTSDSTSCYQNANSVPSSDQGTLTCPSTTTVVNGNVTTTTSYACTYSVGSKSTSCGKGNAGDHYTITQTATPTVQTTTTTSTPTYKFPLQQTQVKTVTTTSTSTQNLGYTSTCSAAASSCSTADYSVCSQSGTSCTCDSTTQTTTGTCASGSSRYMVVGNYTVSQETATGTYTTDTATYNADEWARFLHDVGVPVGTSKSTVNTYTIDVYNAAPNATQSGLLSSMARNGGGKYFSAQSEAAILSALKTIFAEIQAVNDVFASAALPISATNRAQSKNEVYIGMFRPDQGDHPRWFGNLKRYQVAKVGGFDTLAGQDGNAALNGSTGFMSPCAVSYWTTASSGYWYDTTNDLSRIFITQATTSGTAWDAAGNDDTFVKGTCDTTTQWSDYPDGTSVEKGGAAQMLRNNLASRKVYTIGSSTTGASALSTFSTSTTGLSTNSTINSNIAKFIMGQDVTGEISLSASTSARPSIHGDVIHSRPLPVDYGGSTGVVVYYGANDGVYRAVSGSTGSELWSFVAPEHYSTLQRLMDNSPLVLTPNPTPPGVTAISGTTGRDFFFDGSTGLYQNSDNSKVWIYPSMRRGGRMLYAFDVTTPGTPTQKWRVGCPDQSDDTGCTTGMSGIGQTWSTPQVAASVTGYTSGGAYKPVVIVGGGYDTCEDSDTKSPSCSSPKGAVVYVLDADTGSVIRSFTTTAAAAAEPNGPAVGRSVAADVTLVDVDGDGVVDYAYAADTGGSLYRIDFKGASSSSDWKMSRVAYTNITATVYNRKFLFAPAVLPYKGDIYVAIVSGDREHPLAVSYPYTSPVLNRAYLYLDDPSRTSATDLDGPKMVNQTTNPSCGQNTILPGGTNYGWYMDLRAACTSTTTYPNGCGEQGVTSALIFGGMVTWSTNRPTGSSETCSSSLGEARGYLVNLLNASGTIGVSGICGGSTSSIFAGGGLPPSAVTATIPINGQQETVIIGAPPKDNGCSSSDLDACKFTPAISSTRTRTYWKVNTDNK